MIRRRVLLAAVLVALFVAGWWAGRGQAAGSFYRSFDLLVEVLHAVRTNYVDPVEAQRLVDGALKGMLRDLDPYSQVLSATAYDGLRDSMEGEFDGIGATVDVRGGYPTVIAPIEGSPAWEAGLLPGDVIVRIDDRPAWGLSLDELGERLRGEPGTPVTLTLSREGEGDTHEMRVVRGHVVTRSVPYAFLVAPGVGVVRIARFSDGAGREVRAALDSLRAQGARAYVLDVRGNPGGLMQRAVDVAGEFLPRGTLVAYTRGRGAQPEQRFVAESSNPLLAAPLAVLVDGGSASAAEVLAGALQDADRAVIVGSTTFGKGSVQNVFPLKGRGGALKLTTALYYTPTGRSIHRLPPAADLEGVEGEDAVAPHPVPVAPADTAGRPEYRTPAGRTVRGGGGVTPDVAVEPDSLPPIAHEVDTHRLAFRFADQWRRKHPSAGDTPTADAMAEFRGWLASEKRTVSDADWSRERDALERVLAREFARRHGGEGAAARRAAADDAPLRRAVRLLERAKAPRDVFAVSVGGSR